jgi:hypothetical protein
VVVKIKLSGLLVGVHGVINRTLININRMEGIKMIIRINKCFMIGLLVINSTRYKTREGSVHQPIVATFVHIAYSIKLSETYAKEYARDQIATKMFKIRKSPHIFDFLFRRKVLIPTNI